MFPVVLPDSAQVPTRQLFAALRTRRFWMAVARNAVPVVGVLWFDWSAVSIAAFFLLESWLFLSSRATVEITFDPEFAHGQLPKTAGEALVKTTWMFLLTSIACAILVLGFGGVVALMAFTEPEINQFFTNGWRQTSFLVGVFGLVADILLDSIALKRRLLDRTPAERQADDLRTRLMFYRVAALMLACMVIAVASTIGIGGPVLVLLLSIILIYVEVFPRRAVRLLD